MDLVSSKGSRQISYKDVAQAAGVSVGKLQHHFGTRDDLIREAFEHRLLRVTKRIQRIREQPGSAAHRLSAAVEEATLRNTWQRSTIWIDLLGRSLDSTAYRSLRDLVDVSWRRAFRQIIRDGVDSGEFDADVDVEDAVARIVLTVDGIMVQIFVQGRERVTEEAPRLRGMLVATVESALGVALD